MKINYRNIYLHTYFILACTLISGLLFSSCLLKSEPKYPFPEGFPEQEIVFMPYDPHFFHGITRKTIGFVNEDGSQRRLYSFLIEGGSAVNYPRNFSTYVIGPRWSRNGNELVFTIADVIPNFRIIDNQGYMHGEECTDLDLAGEHLGFDDEGNIVAWISKLNYGYEQFESEVGENERLIVRYDVKHCRVVETFSIPFPSKYWVSDVNISKNEILTAMIQEVVKYTYQEPEKPYSVLIYNMHSGEHQTFPGYHPSLSDDGALLAYYGYDGGLTVRKMDTNEEWILDYIFEYENDFEFISRPGWSTDQLWLVFNNREGEIFKININTLEKKYLTKGYTPDWK